jgi:hypothetical protein
MTQHFNISAKRISLAFGAIALSASALAQAEVYGFKFASGAQNNPTIKQSGDYIFADVTENFSTPANDVLFKLTSSIPESVSGLARFVFDTGSYTTLFSSMSIFAESPGVDMSPVALTTHPYLPGLTPDYAFGFTNGVLYDPRAVNPGEYLTVSGTLGAGKSFADVIAAMSVGINSATASSGLRIGVLAYNLLGTRIDPTKTLMDDAGFVTASIVPVPEAETWTLMLAGLGLVGFMARRRKV